jgi:antigen 43
VYGDQSVESGGVSYGAYVAWIQQVDYGGVASNTSVVGYGGQFVSRGIAVSAYPSAGGQQWLRSDGVADYTSVASGRDQEVDSSGTAQYAVIYSGGLARTLQDGFDDATSVLNGGAQNVYGSSLSATIDSGGAQIVMSGGVATSATQSGYVSAGGTQTISSGGLAQYDYDAWLQNVYFGGTADYTEV